MRIASLVVLMASPLAGCSNPFLDHYRGLRLASVNTAQVATQPPQDATLIGMSDFTTAVAVGDAEAIAAAERVGANIVQWDRAFLRQDVELARQALLPDSGGTAPISDLPAATGEPTPTAEGGWYRVHARFWRSNALGGFPPAPTPPATPEPEPVPMPRPTLEPSSGADSKPEAPSESLGR